MKHHVKHKKPRSIAKIKAWRIGAFALGIVLLAACTIWGVSLLYRRNASAAQTGEAVQSAAPASENSPGQSQPADTQTPQSLPAQTPQNSQSPLPPQATEPAVAAVQTKQTPTEYDAYLKLSAGRIYGMLRIHYQNESGADLYAVALNLFANAASARCLQVTGISVSQKPLAFTYADEGHTALVAPLYREIKSGESAEIFIEFTLAVPAGTGALGYNKTGTSLYAILPRIAPVENGMLKEAPLTAGAAPTEPSDFRIAFDAGSTKVTAPETAVQEAGGLWYIAADDETAILIQTQSQEQTP